MVSTLTEEEIINKFWENPSDLLSSVPKMMNEFAKQESIEFFHFALEFTIKNMDLPEDVSDDKLWELYLQEKALILKLKKHIDSIGYNETLRLYPEHTTLLNKLK